MKTYSNMSFCRQCWHNIVTCTFRNCWDRFWFARLSLGIFFSINTIWESLTKCENSQAKGIPIELDLFKISVQHQNEPGSSAFWEYPRSRLIPLLAFGAIIIFGALVAAASVPTTNKVFRVKTFPPSAVFSSRHSTSSFGSLGSFPPLLLSLLVDSWSRKYRQSAVIGIWVQRFHFSLFHIANKKSAARKFTKNSSRNSSRDMLLLEQP